MHVKTERLLVCDSRLHVLQAGERCTEEATQSLEGLPSSSLAEVLQSFTDGGGTLLLDGAQLQRLLPGLVDASAFELAGSIAHALAERQREEGNYRVSATGLTNFQLVI